MMTLSNMSLKASINMWSPIRILLLCHAACDDVLGKLLLHERGKLGPVAAVQDL